MNKLLTKGVVGAVVMGCTVAFAVALESNTKAEAPSTFRQQMEAARQARIAKGAPAAAKAARKPARVMGGANGDKPLYGAVAYAYDGPFYLNSAPVQIDGSNVPLRIGPNFSRAIFSGCYFDGNFLAVLYDSSEGDSQITYITYDAETWEQNGNSFTWSYDSPNILAYAPTYDPTTSTIYTCVFADGWNYASDTDAQLAVIDLSYALDPIKKIGDLPVRMRAMAATADGTLLGVGEDGWLYSINKSTAEATQLVEVTLPSPSGEGNPWDSFYTYAHESMVCDWETGNLYMSYGDDFWDTCISRIDPVTGQGEIVADYSYDFGDANTECVVGLFFKQSMAQSATAPESVTNLNVAPVGIDLKAEVSFTLPANDIEGNPITKPVDWTVTNGDAVLGQGQGEAGEAVTTTVDVPAQGQTTFVVTPSVGGESGRAVNVVAFIGPDTPSIPGTPTLRASGNRLTLTWYEAYPLNLGNLGDITYKVTRMPDNVVVAEATPETRLVDDIESEIKTAYYYIIEPTAGPVTGEAVTSRQAYAGTYFAMPYSDSFTDGALFLEYPVIDANNDGNLWDINTNSNREAAFFPGNENAADDYLLIGPFKMEAGSAYAFHMTAGGHNRMEQVALYIGTDPDDAAGYTELIAPTIINPMEADKSLSVTYEATESGLYYFAIHACSAANSQYLYIYDVDVKEIGANSPAAPTEVEAIPLADAAELHFTMPLTNVDGSSADDLTEARIFRDDEHIGTVTEGVAKGARLTFTDTDAVSKGMHRYTVVAVNTNGQGKPAEVQLYRGLDYPGSPTSLRFWEDLNTPGLIHMTFDAPTRGYYGGYVNPDEIFYLIEYTTTGGQSGLVELGYGTEHTLQLSEPAAQEIFAGSVYGRNTQGAIRSTWTTAVATVGPAQSLPLRESWPGMTQRSGIWTGQYVDDNMPLFSSRWDISCGSAATILPQDGDGGMLAMSNDIDQGRRRILTPRVTLQGTANPCLVFYYYATADATSLTVQIAVDDQPMTTLSEAAIEPQLLGQWIRATIQLNQFRDAKYVQFGFLGQGNIAEEFLAIDNVTIADMAGKDLSVISFEAPSRLDTGMPADFRVVVRNTGNEPVSATDYTVDLFLGNTMVDRLYGEDLQPDAQADFNLCYTAGVTDPATAAFHAEIVYADDEMPANNVSDLADVLILTPDYPTVNDLKAEGSDAIALNWSDPSTENMCEPVTESFEAYEPFIISNIGDWTLVDGDGHNTVRMATALGVLDYPHIGEPMAWQVMDPAAANIFHGAWYPRTGSNMLVSFQAVNAEGRDEASNDWLISPRLSGAAQTISFFARTGMNTYSPEVFDLMVSYTTNDIDAFGVFAADVNVPDASDWHEFIYRLPAGVRYFAIVHKSRNQMAMMIDDITYAPESGDALDLQLNGFNIYRDGQRLTDEPVAANQYIDTDVELHRDYSYNVSAVYDRGESALSNTAVARATVSVGDVNAHNVTITGMQGFVRIAGLQGEEVTVSTLAGVIVARTADKGTVDVRVPGAGVYVVTAGNQAVKIIVR